jgi:hypothetical protein
MRIECTLLGGKLYILKAPFIHVDNNIKPLNSNQVPIAATTTPQISSMDLETNAFPAPAVSLSKVPVDVGVKVVSKAKSILGLKLSWSRSRCRRRFSAHVLVLTLQGFIDVFFCRRKYNTRTRVGLAQTIASSAGV